MAQSLAVKYRPQTWDDVTEQEAVRVILRNQLETGDIRHAYLFCGGAGTGKTTCARIFAKDINDGKGNPIEMDAASNNSVEDIRTLIEQAKTRSLDSEYKIFILDECHALSNSAWQAMLKLLEEPPAKSIFIFCTTDPQKIPKTILSRVQRYDFQRISTTGIVTRLRKILESENRETATWDWDNEAVDYVARLADGGMRDAITMMDKALAFSNELTVETVSKALGLADYKVMRDLTDAILCKHASWVLECVDTVHSEGKDLKQFIRQYLQFMVDVCTVGITQDMSLTTLPGTFEMKEWLSIVTKSPGIYDILNTVMKLLPEIKWDTTPKALIQCRFLLLCREEQ